MIARAAFVAAILVAPLSTANGDTVLRSTAHRIECWNSKGDVIRRYRNDPRGPYFSSASHVVFLDADSGQMARLSTSSCVETWAPNQPY